MRYIDNKKENVPAKAGADYREHLGFSTSYSFDSMPPSKNTALKDFNREQRFSGASANSKYSEKSHSRSERQSDSYHKDYRKSQGSRNSRSTAQGTSYDEVRKPKSSSKDYDNTIAIFGAYGMTGQYFMKLAVEAGYHVRALMLPGIEMGDMADNPNVSLITGMYDDEAKITRVIRKAAYVVCMLNDCHQILEGLPAPPSNFEFIQKLVPAMASNPVPGVLLYQASSAASDPNGEDTLFSNVVKKMAVRKVRRDTLRDQDRVVDYICNEVETDENEQTMEYPFKFIVTRPSGIVWDRPSRKKLAPSKTHPGPFPIANIDLAEFSLNALKSKKLYNTCPYVVQDGI